MSAKRRDNRNRILRGGESQRKDGRYMYKYIDNAENAKYVYSWKLVKNDTVPQGAKNDISLRDKEKQIHKDSEDDDLIRKNPFEFQLATVVVNDSVTREAITRITKDYTSCMQAYLLFQHGEIGNESKNIAENNGTFRYWCNTEYLYTFRV